MKEERQSNIELLRIILMLMIVFFHYYIHGIGLNNNLTLNNLILQSICFAGKIAVNVFVIISGYYLINLKFSLIKFIKFVFQIKFYDVTIMFLSMYLGYITLTKDILFKSIFPLASMNWFASVYIILYLLTPIINFVLRVVKKEILLKGIVLLFIVFIVLPSLFYYKFQSNMLVLFLILYSIGAYLRLHCGLTANEYSCVAKKIVFFSICMCYITIFAMDVLGNLFNYTKGIFYFVSSYSVFSWTMSIGIFLWFKNLRVNNNRYINFIASTVFGVYLIHDNPLISKFIWVELLKTNLFYYSETIILLLHCVLSVITVFVVCSIIEIVRMYLFDSYLLKSVDKKLTRLQEVIDFYISSLVKRLS